MLVVIEVCDVNPFSAVDLESLEVEFPGVSVLRTECLSQCELCASSPYAYVNGDILIEETNEALLKIVREKITEELRFWE